MSYYVLSFAAKHHEPIFRAVQGLAQNHFVSLSGMRKSSQGVVFESLSCSFEEATQMLLEEKILSLISKPGKMAGANIIINRPFLLGDVSPLWYAEIDGLPVTGYDYFRYVRSVSGLQVVAFCFEDSIDLSRWAPLTEATFPWDDWHLIEAVVAKSDVDMTKSEARCGPAFNQHADMLHYTPSSQ